MVVAFGRRELLDQFGVAFQRRQVQRGELPARQRGALPDVFQQLLPARCCQQRCGRLGPRQPFGCLGGGSGRPAASVCETARAWRTSDEGLLRGAFWPFRVGPFPLVPFPCPFPALWPLRKPLGIGPQLRQRHDECGMGRSHQAGSTTGWSPGQVAVIQSFSHSNSRPSPASSWVTPSRMW